MNSNSPRSELAYLASIIVPAHNEVDRISSLLVTLKELASQEPLLIVVSCNACTDGTANLARTIDGIHVLESDTMSKTSALNDADRFASGVFPRLYIDADAVIDANSIRHLIEALRTSQPLAVRPSSHHLVEGTSWFVRAWYESLRVTPWALQWSAEHLEGNAVYGTNEAGRQKFDLFPEILADDAFFDRMFDPDEKLVVHRAEVGIPATNNLRNLLRTLVRVHNANRQLIEWLTLHRPDRLGAAALTHERLETRINRWDYYRSGGSTFPSWKPRTVLIIVTGIAIRLAARNVARWNDFRGRQSPWR